MLDDQRKRKGYKLQKNRTAGTFKHVGSVALLFPKRNTIIQDRLVTTSGLLADDDAGDVAFQHTILCQAGLPYRNPGPDVRQWERRQGNASLLIEAGQAFHEESGEWVRLDLPWGPKARLILLHLNTAAIRTQSAVVDVGDSLTAFVKRIGLSTDGRTIRDIKSQLGALSVSNIRMAFKGHSGSYQLNTPVVFGFDLWFPKDARQRVLWPSTVQLSGDYFSSLQNHAVPLDERAIGALSHSALALDVYTWLAQRLHRIPKPHWQLLAWPLVKQQFGGGYKSMKKFRQVFITTLKQVHAVYPAMKIDITDKGLFLHTSPPPVVKTGSVRKLPGAKVDESALPY